MTIGSDKTFTMSKFSAVSRVECVLGANGSFIINMSYASFLVGLVIFQSHFGHIAGKNASSGVLDVDIPAGIRYIYACWSCCLGQIWRILSVSWGQIWYIFKIICTMYSTGTYCDCFVFGWARLFSRHIHSACKNAPWV